MKNPFKDLSNHNKCGFAIILSLCFLIACDSDDAPSQESLLPPITMTGENTFGCLIDGKFFRPRDGNNIISSGNRGLKIRATETSNFEIEINDFKSDKKTSMLIHLEDLFNLNEGIYEVNESNGRRGLDGNNNSYMHARVWNEELQSYQGYLSYANSGSILITKRTFIPNQSHIYSGTFEGRLINISNVNDTIDVSLGRFDIDAFTFDTISYN